MGGMTRRGFDLGAQPMNVDVDRPGVDVPLAIPREIQKLTATEGSSGVRGERRQELVLLWSERDRAAVTPELVGAQVEDDRLGNGEPRFEPGEHEILRQTGLDRRRLADRVLVRHRRLTCVKSSSVLEIDRDGSGAAQRRA